MIEGSFTADIHKRLRAMLGPELLEDCIVWKINDDYTSGKPDAYYSGPKANLLVEYKFYQRLPTRKFKVPVTEEQRKWLLKEYYNGNTPTYVVIGSPTAIHLITDVPRALLDKHQIDSTMSRHEYVQWLYDQII